MRLAYHPLVQNDVTRILRHYDRISPRLGDEFWTELMRGASQFLSASSFEIPLTPTLSPREREQQRAIRGHYGGVGFVHCHLEFGRVRRAAVAVGLDAILPLPAEEVRGDGDFGYRPNKF